MRYLLAAAATLLFSLPRVAAAQTEPMPPTQKCFLALEVPPATTETLEILQGELGRKAKDVDWTNSAGFHVTLRFLGDQPGPVLARLTSALEGVGQSTAPIPLTARGLGTFPYRSRRSAKASKAKAKAKSRAPDARVLWAGVAGDRPALDALATNIEAAVQAAGLPPPDYPFRPHLTLGRAKQRQAMRPLAEVLRDLQEAEFGPLTGSSFTLFTVVREEPHGGYRVLKRFPLTGSSSE